MPTQQRLSLAFNTEIERERMRQAFERLPAAARKRGFDEVMQNRAMEIGLRRMAEIQGNSTPLNSTRSRKKRRIPG